MTYKVVRRKVQENLELEHCMIKEGNENNMWNIVQSVPANFYTIEMTSSKGFVHVTPTKNIESIKQKGLLCNETSKSHLGPGIYCLSGENSVFQRDISNFLRFVNLGKIEELSLVFGHYYGSLLYCIDGDDYHRGYTVLLNDVPNKQLTDIVPMSEFIGKDIFNLIESKLISNYELMENIIYQEFLKSNS